MATLHELIPGVASGPADLDASWLRTHFLTVAQDAFDLTRAEDLDAARDLAELVAARRSTSEALEELETELVTVRDEVPLALHLAVKLARSRALLRERTGPLFLSVAFAVYKEHQRLLTPEQHPHGEDFLDRKLAQLEWLLADRPGADFELVVVDDGCPEGSGDLVAARARELGERGARVRVLKLADAIAAHHPVTAGLQSTDDSRKGGSIALGLWEAVHTTREGHVAVFTDADLSTHLGQAGLLAAPILDGRLVAIGSRRHERSVVIKGGARNDRGKLFIYLWKGILAPLTGITDTQCGFKAFDARILPRILDGLLEKQFAFDIELMLRAQLERPDDPDVIERVPLAWFDSEALSTTTDIQPYLAMLKKVAMMYRRYLPPRPEADELARLIEDLDEERWQALLNRIPRAITDRDPREFGTWRGVRPDELR